jgi:hypothetical protein
VAPSNRLHKTQTGIGAQKNIFKMLLIFPALQRGRKMGQRSERSERRNGADATFGSTVFASIKASEKNIFKMLPKQHTF